MNVQELPFEQLDRYHKQAQAALEVSLKHQNKTVYRNAEELEERYRREKVRRQRERNGPPSVNSRI